jgi:hypothetical protein
MACNVQFINYWNGTGAEQLLSCFGVEVLDQATITSHAQSNGYMHQTTHNFFFASIDTRTRRQTP